LDGYHPSFSLLFCASFILSSLCLLSYQFYVGVFLFMNLLIASAWADAGAAATPGLADFIPLIVLFVVFYFFLIRPQTKRVKEHKALISSLAKGDEVVTNGGLMGRVKDLGENFLLIEVASGVEVKVQRHAINSVMPKGTLKTL
jgi:preprotein translocase subunit YajC